MTYRIGDKITVAHPMYGWYEVTIDGITYHPDGTVQYYHAGKHWITPQEIVKKEDPK